MAHRKGGYPSRGAYALRKVRFTPQIALSTLANVTVITANLGTAGTAPLRLVSVIANWSLRDAPGGEGPIVVGFAHGDYTVAEIKEALEAVTSLSRSDKIAQERANRLVRVVGQFPAVAGDSDLNDGKPIKTRLNWRFESGEAPAIFAYNDSGAILTGAAIVNVVATGWVKDSN